MAQELFDVAFARLDRAQAKRKEFGQVWNDFISVHPGDIDVRAIEPCLFEIYAVMREPAPLDLSMVFSEWLAAIRAALDNGMYAWVSAATGQNPPPHAERIQYPVCATPKEFKEQRRRLSAVPSEIMDRVERAQPYQSPLGPESNLTYWIHELARTDRHRSAHIGVGASPSTRLFSVCPRGSRPSSTRRSNRSSTSTAN